MSQSCEVALSILEFEKAGKPFEVVNDNFSGVKDRSFRRIAIMDV